MKIALSSLFIVVLAGAAHADSVHLKIVGPDQKPIPNAQVHFVEFKGYDAPELVQNAPGLKSDENGLIDFESKNSLAQLAGIKGFTEQNVLMVQVLAPGFAAGRRPLKAGDNEMTLEEGHQWSGLVYDDQQKPVAGVKIALIGTGTGAKEGLPFVPPQLKTETGTDKDGHWSFDNVPLRGWARIGVESDRFVNTSFAFDLDSTIAPPLYLELGATIKGRVLTPAGEPAADVQLLPGSTSFSSAPMPRFRTGPDGRFAMKGLPVGDFYVQYIPSDKGPSLPFLIVPQSVKGLNAGEVRDMGDLKTQKGIQVKGTVIESGTKKPLAEVYLQTFGTSFQQVQTNENGVFSLLSDGAAMDIEANATGFIAQRKSLPRAQGEVIDMGVIELKKSLVVTGILKTKEGAVLGSQQFYVESRNGNTEQTYADKEGKFTIDGLEPREYTVKSDSLNFVGNTKFTLAPDKTPPVLQLTAELKNKDTEIRPVQGRTLDNEGKSLAGVKIDLGFNRPEQDFIHTSLTVVSNKDGAFQDKVPDAGLIPKIVSASRPGYILVSSGEFKLVDGSWQTDLVFQPRGGALKGVALNGDGQPAAGAYVSVLGHNNLPIVRADEHGAFSLPDVPLQDVTLIASNGLGYGETKIEKAGDGIQVMLQQRPEEPRTRAELEAFADQLLPQARISLGYDEIVETFEAVGARRFETALLAAKETTPGFNAYWYQYLDLLALRDPKSLLERSEELLRPVPASYQPSQVLVVTLQAHSDDPAHKAKAQAWLDAHKAPSLVVAPASISELLRIGSVAEALKAGDGSRWVEFAAQLAAQLKEESFKDHAASWGESAIQIGPEALDNLTQEWGPFAQFRAYCGASQSLARDNQLESARELLKRAEALLPTIEKSKEAQNASQYEQ
ncbi:hypothetical protein EON80_15085, partial [bacterium]